MMNYEEKKRKAEELLRKAESLYDKLTIGERDLLQQRIRCLRMVLMRMNEIDYQDYQDYFPRTLREVFQGRFREPDIDVLKFCKERYFAPAYRRN